MWHPLRHSAIYETKVPIMVSRKDLAEIFFPCPLRQISRRLERAMSSS